MKKMGLTTILALLVLLLSACDTEQAVESLTQERSEMRQTITQLERHVATLEAENTRLKDSIAQIGEIALQASPEMAVAFLRQQQEASTQKMLLAQSE